MKQELLKKTSLAILLMGVMMFSVSIANAQIIYTNVEPDLMVTRSSNGSIAYNLDLNKDSITDVILSAHQSNPSGGSTPPRRWGPAPAGIFRRVLAATAEGSNLLMVEESLLVPDGLTLNGRVDSTSQVWASATAGLLRHTISTAGKWVDITDRYLAIRIKVAGNWHYGWVRLSVEVTTNNISFTLKDYAYNSIPNQSILAGETATSIGENNFAPAIRLFPNPASSQVTIDFEINNDRVDIQILDLNGKIIYTKTASSQQIEIDTKEFGEGIYFVRIQAENYLITKKLVIEK